MKCRILFDPDPPHDSLYTRLFLPLKFLYHLLNGFVCFYFCEAVEFPLSPYQAVADFRNRIQLAIAAVGLANIACSG